MRIHLGTDHAGLEFNKTLATHLTEAAEAAEEAGLAFTRTPTPGVAPSFVSGIVDLIIERLEGRPNEERPHVTALPGAFDVCRPGCCENVRAGFKPAAAGVAP